jgi:hypothetical protein
MIMRRKSKRKFEVYKKYVPPAFRELTADKLASNSPINRMHSERTHRYPSVVSVRPITYKQSIMDPAVLAKESTEIQESIREKSTRIAPAFNKGAVQYITDECDPSTLGRKL